MSRRSASIRSEPTPDPYFLRRHARLDEISADSWNALVGDDDPLLTHEFLAGLEQHHCLENQGWYPGHMSVHSGATLQAAMPLYTRTNSHGEFVFDWSWADAYERAGGHYYPKLVSAIPFSPVRGPRILMARHDSGYSAANTLANQVIADADEAGISSFHCLFPDDETCLLWQQHGLLIRRTCQFRWFNRGYRDFADFLETLSSKKRKQIRRERNKVKSAGVVIERLPGSSISSSQWRVFYDFYCSTFLRRWGAPRMTLDFFQSLSRNLADSTLLILARHNGVYVAGAFAMVGSKTVFGRHWGCNTDFPFLHFELCYYQTIEYAISHGKHCVDAGVQGEHKLSRGFEPVLASSCHWIRDTAFRDAVARYLQYEDKEMSDYLHALRRHLPYKRNTVPL